MTTEVREVPAKTDPAVPGPPRGVIRIDVTSLRRLRAEVSGEVRFDRATLAMHANGASNFRQVPIGVVIPKTLDDVVAAHRVCPWGSSRASTTSRRTAASRRRWPPCGRRTRTR